MYLLILLLQIVSNTNDNLCFNHGSIGYTAPIKNAGKLHIRRTDLVNYGWEHFGKWHNLIPRRF